MHVFGAVFENLSCRKSFVFEGRLCKPFVFCAADLKTRFWIMGLSGWKQGELGRYFWVLIVVLAALGLLCFCVSPLLSAWPRGLPWLH